MEKKQSVKRLSKLVAISSLVIGTAFYLPQLQNDYMRTLVGPKVVELLGNGSGGTGFHVVAPSGTTYILTNAHICLLGSGQSISVRNPHTGIYVSRRIVARASSHDLCLVESLPNFTGLDVENGPFGEPRVGEIVTAIGHPLLNQLTQTKGEYIGTQNIRLRFGTGLSDSLCIGENVNVETSKYYFSNDILQAPLLSNNLEKMLKLLEQMITMPKVCVANLTSYHITTKILPGNSGSPLLNKFGNVIGVVFAYNSRSTNGFVVPLNVVKNFLRSF